MIPARLQNSGGGPAFSPSSSSGQVNPFDAFSTAFVDRTSPSDKMAAQSFHSNPRPIGPPSSAATSYPIPIAGTSATNGYERESPSAVNNSFSLTSSVAASPKHSVLVRRLALGSSDDAMRHIFQYVSHEITGADLIPPEHSKDIGYYSAILHFESPDAALAAKASLDGKLNASQEATMIVEFLNGPGMRRPTVDLSTGAANTPPSLSSSRGSSRPNHMYQSGDGSAAPFGSLYGNSVGLGMAADLNNSELEGPANTYQYYAHQSPIGNHLSDRMRMPGRAMINDEASNDDTLDLAFGSMSLTEPVSLTAAITAAASTGPQQVSAAQMARPPQPQSQRRSTMPHIPSAGRLNALTLNTTNITESNGMLNGAGMVASPYGQNMGSLSAHPMNMSPAAMNGPFSQPHGSMAARNGRNFIPHANPSDQHPPCNTLYVGNIPLDAHEDELKSLFQKQRGYKRLSLRTKNNNTMCFVEFEDISSATKALNELYGKPLSNSSRGGIRLSFSKNPFGVRTEQNPNNKVSGAIAGRGVSTMSPGVASNGFGMNAGPPPGLSAPPGLGSRGRGFHASNTMSPSYGSQTPVQSTPYSAQPGLPAALQSNMWQNAPQYHPSLNGDYPSASTMSNGGGPAGYPAYMMGR